MAHSISIDDDADLIRIAWNGAYVEEEIAEAFSELMNMPGIRPGLNLLADHRGLEQSPPMHLVPSAIDFLQKFTSVLGPYKLAVVVDKAVSFGTGRMVEGRTFGTDVKVRPFYTPAEAELWLALPWSDS